MRSRLLLGLTLSVLPWAAEALIGMDTRMYNPACAYACSGALDPFMLSCSSHGDSAGGDDMDGMDLGMMTAPECRAGDSAYLTTLAWCMHTKCAKDAVPTSLLEKYWAEHASGDPAVAPKWDYGATLANITRPPTRELATDDMLDSTALTPADSWTSQYGTMTTVEYEETMHARYCVILLVTAFGTPILLTSLRHLPYMTTLLDRLHPYLTYPSAVPPYQVRPLPYLLGNAPTIGQALYVLVLLILNIVLSAISYRSFQPNVWYETQYREILAWVMYRTGSLAFAMLPLVLLFAGRNNVLLWVSDWSHASYVLLHRWVARIFGVQVILHSILALVLYKDTGAYAEEEKQPWWIWGAVGTVGVGVTLVGSGLYVRRWSYEVFLVMHVLLAVFVVAGCWYHVELRFMRMFGYEMWIYAACAVWFFDRLLRVLRILKAGVRRARVTEVGDDFVRVEIEGVRWGTTPGQHAYLYFPTLNPLRPWENHPFSLLPSAILARPHSPSGSRPASETEQAEDDPEKAPVQPTTTTKPALPPPETGITLFIRKSTGLTRSLKSNSSLLTLLDGPYPNNPTAAILRCDRVLLVAGGIGITGVLPWARSSGHANAKLWWSVRRESGACLVDALREGLEGVKEKEVRVGGRFDVRGLLAEEATVGWKRIGVVVCGPGGLCDEVRAVVAEMGRREKGVVWELEVDAYSW